MKRFIYITVIVVILAVSSIWFYSWYTNPYRQAAKEVGTTYLSPSYLPPGVTIAKKILFHNTVYPSLSSIVLSFRNVDNVYAIYQGMADQPIAEATTSLTNFDSTSIKPTCRQMNTQKNQSYRLCHWVDYGTYSVFETTMMIDHRWVQAKINTTPDKPFSVDDISRFVDSFESRSITDLPVTIVNGGG